VPDAPGGMYDHIGAVYRRHRRPDPRIAASIGAALGDVHTVVDIGSGTGSYEPRGCHVVAVEPSWTMIAERPAKAAPVVRAVAERLPFRDGTFDAALAIFTIHHWSDPETGLAEMRRVSTRQVILTWDPEVYFRFWLFEDYLPEIPRAEAHLPALPYLIARLPVRAINIVPVSWDCTDGFCAAYWRRPEMYLDTGARTSISGIARCDPQIVSRAMDRLKRDLADARWDARHRELRKMPEMDLGYRLVVAES
jgi:SAM-dependent methyltransferase